MMAKNACGSPVDPDEIKVYGEGDYDPGPSTTPDPELKGAFAFGSRNLTVEVPGQSGTAIAAS